MKSPETKILEIFYFIKCYKINFSKKYKKFFEIIEIKK